MRAWSVSFEKLSPPHERLRSASGLQYWERKGRSRMLPALQQFGREFEGGVPADEIPDVFFSVEARRAQFGVVPVENSNQGDCRQHARLPAGLVFEIMRRDTADHPSFTDQQCQRHFRSRNGAGA